MSDKRFHFTNARLDALPVAPPGTRVTYHDTKEPGLQLRVGPTGKKQFCVFKRTRYGNPERITIGPYPDVRIEQARTRTLQIKNAIAIGENPAEVLRAKRAEMTLGEAFEWYIEHHAMVHDLKTIDAMRGNFERYLGALPTSLQKKHGRPRQKSPGSVNWQHKKLSAIKPAHVLELRSALAKQAGRSAANHAHKLLRTIFNQLINARIYTGENPVAGLGTLKIKARDRFLSKIELPRLFEALEKAKNTAIRDYILLSLLTGARKSNVLAMRWDEIRFDEAEWHIPETKNGEGLVVHLAPQAITVLNDRRDNDSPWVFPGSGKSGHLQSPKRGVNAILAAAGITDLRIHDLRRTLGSWQAILGSSLIVIGKSLGHKSVAATSIYARLSADPVRQSIERATNAMFHAGGIKELDATPSLAPDQENPE